MIFLKKKNDSRVISLGLKYSNSTDRTQIREIILEEQYGFCAYSERHIQKTDSPEIEHFDPQKKGTPQDDYCNWYVVIRWMNAHKPKNIEPFIPILLPCSEEVENRIKYQSGIFTPESEEDIEAKHLIDFLGVNKYEVVQDRTNHVTRIKTIKALCAGDDDLFLEKMKSDKFNLSFGTALKHELGINIMELLN